MGVQLSNYSLELERQRFLIHRSAQVRLGDAFQTQTCAWFQMSFMSQPSFSFFPWLCSALLSVKRDQSISCLPGLTEPRLRLAKLLMIFRTKET